jgi:phosphatidylserine/phosphatidylglycerophosphate/cardiolipin synthase-like enzyme
MVVCRKYCGRSAIAVLLVLVAAWVLGNVVVDLKFDGRDPNGDPTFITSEKGNTLREVFEGLPARGFVDSRIELLDDNVEAWAARWRLLAASSDTLEISYFILDPDIFGISFLGHLLHKAQEGTRVRILLDAIGTSLSREINGNDYLDALAGVPNVTVKIYRPYWSRFRDAFLTLNPLSVIMSEHDKILVADDRQALIGGRNIARDYLADPRDYNRAFRDADLLITTARKGMGIQSAFTAGFESAQAYAVKSEAFDLKDSRADLLLAYEAMNSWVRGAPMPPRIAGAIRERGLPWLEDLEKLPRLKGAMRKRTGAVARAEVRLLDSRPRLFRSDDAISQSLARLVKAARREIFIQTPYLMLSPPAVSVLQQAAARGVRITILTNSPVSTDNPLSQAIFLEQWPKLLAKVPALRLFVVADVRNIHGKLAAIDGELALIGTYNLDPLSMSLNGELAAAIWSDRFAAQLLRKPRRLISKGAPLVHEYRIGRDAEGRPRRDGEGRLVIAFGPEDHSSPEQWKTVQGLRKVVRAAACLPGTSGLLWE